MEILPTASRTKLPDSALRSINRCGIFLQVTTLGDITDGTGKIHIGRRAERLCNWNKGPKVYQQIPTTSPPSKSRLDYFQTTTQTPTTRPTGEFRQECLYTYHDNGRIYKSPARTRRQFHSKKTLVPHLPPDAVPVTKTTDATIRRISPIRYRDRNPSARPATDHGRLT
jgi:hypothetical protein